MLRRRQTGRGSAGLELTRPAGGRRMDCVYRRRNLVSWNLTGSYVETCSCELMCPCNLSFDHGATYDFCRVTLVFNIREGEVDGTDIGGLQGRGHRGHAEGHDRGQLAARRVHRRRGERRAVRQARPGVQRPARRADGARWRRWSARCSASSARAIEVDDDGLRHSVRVGDAIDFEIEDIVPVRRRDRRAGALRRHVPPGRLGPDDGRGEALADQRVRHRSTRARPGCRSPSSPGPPEPMTALGASASADGGGLAPAFAAVRARLGLVALLFAVAARRLVVDRRPDARHGRRAVDRPRDASAGSSASGS